MCIGMANGGKMIDHIDDDGKNDKEIIKALECMKGISENDISTITVKNAIALINRQQKQLDNYSHNVRNMAKDFIDQQKIIQEQQAEINRQKAEIEKLQLSRKQKLKEIERLKEKYDRTMTSLKAVLDERADHTEAIKEFAEKVKGKAFKHYIKNILKARSRMTMQNEMRDRLVELIYEARKEWDVYFNNCLSKGKPRTKDLNGFSADHLIENGVIVPPCELGSEIYMLVTRHTKSFTFEETKKMVMRENQHTIVKKTTFTKSNFFKVIEEFGKTVFLTKEEAEQALKGGADNGDRD